MMSPDLPSLLVSAAAPVGVAVQVELTSPTNGEICSCSTISVATDRAAALRTPPSAVIMKINCRSP